MSLSAFTALTFLYGYTHLCVYVCVCDRYLCLSLQPVTLTLSLPCVSEDKEESNKGKFFTLDDAFNSSLKPRSFSMRWISGGSKFSITSRYEKGLTTVENCLQQGVHHLNYEHLLFVITHVDSALYLSPHPEKKKPKTRNQELHCKGNLFVFTDENWRGNFEKHTVKF